MQITNEDNMAVMARYPDNYFDLAIVDPPYGINMAMGHKGSEKRGDKNKYKSFAGLDNSIPNKEYFDELFRVSQNQIIWGANYMIEFIKPSASWIVWDKKQPEDFSMAMGELAWTSINKPLKIYNKRVVNADTIRIHPTQKPVALYKWLLMNYAKPNDKILDTHLGSGSIAIACYDLGFDLTACELDTDYFNGAVKRLENHKLQLKIF
jgi:site-specific DNA-methyltransferase (adenine-specific)